MSKKILVTGGSGFIGRNIVEQLRGKYEVSAPSSTELNLLDTEAVRRFLQDNLFDAVVHAANRNQTREKIEPYDALDGNLRMFFNLERCHTLYGKMLYFGSGAENDRKHYVPNMPEDYFDTYVPGDPYGFSKYVMAKACLQNDNIFDLILYGVYGKYEEWERRFISNAICRALKGRDITLHQNVYFDYLWVDDLVDILIWFIENEPRQKRYNVCRGRKIDLYSLAVMVKEILEIDCEIVVDMPGWKPEYTGDNGRLLKEIGGYSFTGFRESVAELCAYYKRNLNQVEEEKL